MALNSNAGLSVFCRWPERKAPDRLLSLLLLCRSHERSSLPSYYFFGFRGLSWNVIKSKSVFCHAAWTVGSLTFSMQSSIAFSCYWTQIKSAWPAPLYQQYVFVLQAWPGPAACLCFLLSSMWSQLFQGCSPCNFVIFTASGRPALSLSDQKTLPLDSRWPGF